MYVPFTYVFIQVIWEFELTLTVPIIVEVWGFAANPCKLIELAEDS